MIKRVVLTGGPGSGKTTVIESIKKIDNAEERKNKIDFSVQHNILTQEEANELY